MTSTEPGQTSLIGDILVRTKEFCDLYQEPPTGFTMATLQDIKLHAEGHRQTVNDMDAEWTTIYRELIRDVRDIIVSHTDLATGSDAWHECVAQLLRTVALDYVHR